jgi:hypothetical protein
LALKNNIEEDQTRFEMFNLAKEPNREDLPSAYRAGQYIY